MSVNVYAHTPPENGGDWQTLCKHAVGVARRARRFAARFGAGPLGYLAGLLHDLGKGSEAFQHYLRESHRRQLAGEPRPPQYVDHKLAGVREEQARRSKWTTLAEVGDPQFLPMQRRCRTVLPLGGV